ncbi:MAG: MFS transporter [Haloferacaceae archaeon]
MTDSRFAATIRQLLDSAGTEYRYHVIYFTYFLAFNGLVTFRNAYFDEIGLTGSQMGLIGALLVTGGLLAQPVWGVIADYSGATRQILLTASLVSGAAVFLFPAAAHVPWEFPLLIVATLVVSVFRAPITPIADSMVLSAGLSYGQIRGAGSLAFGLGSLGLGVIAPHFGLSTIFYLYAVGMAVVSILVWNLPNPRADISPDLKRDAITLLGNDRFLLLLVIAVIIPGAMAGADAFLSVYLRRLTGGDSITGVAWLIKTFSEAVVFVWLSTREFDNRTLLTAGGVLTVLAYLVLGSTQIAPLAVGVLVVSGSGVALFFYAAVNMTHRYAPLALAATAQTLLSSIGMGVGRATSELGSGWLVSTVGVQSLYLFLAAAATLATLISLRFHAARLRATIASGP